MRAEERPGMDPREEKKRLLDAIRGLESQRSLLGDAVVDASVAALREKLSSLEQTPQPGRGRKLVTVLFADVSGFTALAEKMDAEDVTDLVDRLWLKLDAIITGYGGIVDKHSGDELMALWGTRGAREDDPERAVRAALDIQSAIGAFGVDGRAGLTLRIGINTGPVMLAEVGTTREYTAMGDVVNVASRLQGACPVGGILISRETRGQVRGIFDMEALDPLQVKNREAPVHPFIVRSVTGRAFRTCARGIEGISTSMIGRETELGLLEAALTGLDGGRLITVSGEAGIGKSRLLQEFEDRIPVIHPGASVYRGRADQSMQSAPGSLLRDVFASALGIHDSDSTAEVAGKLEQGVTAILSAVTGVGQARLYAHFLGQFMGFDFTGSPLLAEAMGGTGSEPDPRQIRERAILYACRFFREAARPSGLVILLEDLHWADDTSLDTMERVILSAGPAPVMVVCTTRPVLFEDRPGWGTSCGGSLVPLEPLSDGQAGSLLDEMGLTAGVLPETVRESIIGSSEGNPFYLEELVRMLVEDGLVRNEGEGWTLDPGRVPSIRVPSSLTAVLQARFDMLPRDEQVVLQMSSVIGRTFWDRAVDSLAAMDEDLESRTAQCLESLSCREMVDASAESAFEGAREFCFRHALLRDATYESVLRRDRRIYHSRAADWLMRNAGERLDEFSSLVAEHLAGAGRGREAFLLLERAGRHAASRYSNIEAESCFRKALSLLDSEDAMGRFGVLEELSRLHELTGDSKGRREDVDEMSRLAGSLGPVEKAKAVFRQAGLANSCSRYAEGVELARSAASLAREAGDVELELSAALAEAAALQDLSRNDEFVDLVERGLSRARSSGLERLEARMLLHLGTFRADTGSHAEARTAYEKALEAFSRLGEARGESYVLHNLALMDMNQGDLSAAESFFGKSLEIDLRIGDRKGEAHTLVGLGLLDQMRGNLSEARADYGKALEVYKEIADRLGEASVLINLGSLASELGGHDDATAMYRKAVSLCRTIGSRSMEAVAVDNMCLALLRSGEPAAALEQNDRALVLAEETGDTSLAGIAHAKRGHVLMELGRPAEAAGHYSRSAELQRGLDSVHLEMEAIAGLAYAEAASGNTSDAAVHAARVRDWFMEGGSLDGAEDPFRALAHLWSALAATGAGGDSEVLESARRMLEERAARIPDERDRSGFLRASPCRRILGEEAAAGGDYPASCAGR
jgi:class 3 adenylate cyclase/tetratricopeptide (TPR) repeat protein